MYAAKKGCGKRTRRRRPSRAALVVVLLAIGLLAVPAGAPAEQASQPAVPAAGYLDASAGATDLSGSTCARSVGGTLRCWGFGGAGRLGYGSVDNIGDDETPGSVAPVALGPGRTVVAVSTGGFHACALLDDGTVRCWGFGADGRLGYDNVESIGDDESPASGGPVDLGPGRTAKAISAGGGHTCAVLDDGSVRCWGFGDDGRLGYGNALSIGDNETPGSVGPVDLGPARTAKAISAGATDTCALLDNGAVRCWGLGANGQLGYGNTTTIGQATTPGAVGPVDLGAGRTATAISAGSGHTCAVLDNGAVRCWGFGGNGRLGTGNVQSIGDNEAPASIAPIDLGPGRTAKGISAGDNHTCAILDDASVRCWGFGDSGRLGYANTRDVGDDETPGSLGPVDLGAGRTAVAISAGGRQTCALLDDQSIRCWGDAALGRLGYCNSEDVGDTETPGSVGAVNLSGPSAGCATLGGGVPAGDGDASAPAPEPGPASPLEVAPADGATARQRALDARARAAQAVRAAALRACLRRAKRAAGTRRRASRHGCLTRHGRVPDRVRGLIATPAGRSTATLRFRAGGTAGSRPPAATRYTVTQSSRSPGSPRGRARKRTLCGGTCRFAVTRVGTQIVLKVTDLLPGTTYIYAVTARDNVSGRRGPRPALARVRTRR